MSAWTDLGEGASVRRSRVVDMNSVVLERDAWAVVVDPGVLPSEMAEIASRVAERAPRFDHVALALTHPHWDHVLGSPWFPAAITVAHVGFADEAGRDAESIEREAAQHAAAAGEAWPRPFEAFTPTYTMRGTAALDFGPVPIVAHDTPGHCASHLAFWFPDQRLLAAGDLLSDIEIPWLDAAPWVYRRTLTQLHWVLEQEDVRVMVPGHGTPALGRVDAYRRLLRDLDYLLALEAGITEQRGRGVPAAEAHRVLSAMSYLGKDDDAYPTNPIHSGNIAIAWETASALEPDESAPPRP